MVSTVGLLVLAFSEVAYKSRKRLFGQDGGLVKLSDIIMGKEKLIDIETDNDGEFRMTAEELAEFDGTDGGPIYLAIMGRIYDVSEGKEYYGVGRSYHHFVGKDATRAFCTGCKKPECLISSLTGLDEYLKSEARRWLELFELHDKYKFIGVLVQDPLEKIMEERVAEEKMMFREDGTRRTPSELFALGRDSYYNGNLDDSLIYFNGALVLLGEATQENDTILSDDEKMRAELLNTLAALKQKTTRFDEAVIHYQEAVDIVKSNLDQESYRKSCLVAVFKSDQGAAYYQLGDTSKTMERFQEALDIFDRDAENSKECLPSTRANTMLNLAMLYNMKGETNLTLGLLDNVVHEYKSVDTRDNTILAKIVQRAQFGLEQLLD
uniref:Cytochrome b5 heme-binding domain-containing protein n=1 Tax=Mucochytrium quahogii TaxID=96639 RepID=A0A7S2WGT6_9STRA|mmetsp:Transcript_15032/g.26361  ORF Transcript_15032/g.26361 Transcript_15032/m.26361 type:complete len:380 (-) Transcript_15032:1177-2316(-)